MPLFGEAKKKYQRDWVVERRLQGIKYLGGKCVVCGTTKNLNVDHKNPKDKIDHKMWSWSEDRMYRELAKCQLLCETHHRAKTKNNSEYAVGEDLSHSKLTEASVKEIRHLYILGGTSYGKLAKQFDVDKKQIARVVKRETWKHVK